MLPPVSQKFPQRCLRRFRSTVGHRRLGSCRAKPAQIWFGSVWPCQVLAKRIQSGSTPMCKNHRARFRQNKTVPLPVSLTRFSSVHFKVVSMRWKSLSLYVLPLVSRKFPQRCLWNGSNVCQYSLIDDDPLLSFQGRSSSASSFHASLFQAIRGFVMSLALCPQVVSQAFQHFRSSQKQATCGVALPASLSARSFPFTLACPQ